MAKIDFLETYEYSEELSTLQSKANVIDFSARIGVHPAIVVGRLQHDHLIDHS